MKILFLLHDHLRADAGGGGTTLALGERFAAGGHSVSYRSFNELPGNLPRALNTAVWPGYLAGHLTSVLRRNAPEVIDSSLGDLWLWQATGARVARSRPLLVGRSHGLLHVAHEVHLREAANGRMHLSRKYPIYWGGHRLWEVARSLRQADLALFLNPYERDYAIERLGVEPARAHVVRNGVPAAFLRGEIELAPVAGGAVGIAQIGTWRHMKGVHYAVEALTGVLARHERAHVSFLGTGNGPADVLPLFPAGLRDRVRVVSSFERHELPGLLRGHHIKLFPTLAEGFGMSLLEAMACGLAPVASRAPGPEVLLRDGENGLLVAPSDSHALAQALDRLLEDPQLLRHLQSTARRAASAYDWDEIARENLDLYRSGLDGLARP